MTWQRTYPNLDHEIKQIPSILQQNFEVIEDAYATEHYSPATASVSGTHKLGIVGAVYEGTTAQIAALPNPRVGAMAYDTNLGVLVKYTKLINNALLHCNGPNASTTITDEYSHTWSCQVNAKLTTATPKFGTACLSSDATSFVQQTPFSIGQVGSAFTLECWWKPSDVTATSQYLFLFQDVNKSFYGLNLEYNRAGDKKLHLLVSYHGTGWDIDTAGSKTDWVNGTWYKIIVDYDGATYRVFQGTVGALTVDISSASIVPPIQSINQCIIAFALVGCQDEIRITTGGNRYGATATAETGEFATEATIAGWERIGSTRWSRFKAVRTTTELVTAGASAHPLVCDEVDYDSLSEYNPTTGIFTSLAGGVYLIVAQVSMVASAADQVVAGTVTATGPVSTAWNVVGAANNTAAINEYPTPVDTSYNTSQVKNAFDAFSGTFPTLPAGSSSIALSIHWRARRRGCVCDHTCYGQNCTCDQRAYEYTCTCYAQCYGYVGCTCDYTCYQQSKGGCVCNARCYGHSPCSCDYSYDGFVCTTCYYSSYGAVGCSCDAKCYSEDETRPASILRIGGSNYAKDIRTLDTAFTNYTDSWDVDPTTSLPWTNVSVAAIQGFGYTASLASAGCSADVSQCYLTLDWFPPRPVIGLHIYYNGIIYQSTYRPIIEKSTHPYQTVNMFVMIALNAGDRVQLAYTKTMNNDYLFGSPILTTGGFTYFAMHRLPLDCF